MLRPLFLALTLSFALIVGAQPVASAPFSEDPARAKTLTRLMEQRYHRDVAALSGEFRRPLSDIYKERYEMVRATVERKEVLTDASAQAYLDALLDRIRTGNPGHDWEDLRVLFSRSPEVNASSLGEGTILFNIGLFDRLRSESEAAFVLCHELAHYFLDHGNANLRKYVATINSKEFQAQLREIRRSEYRQNQQLDQLAKGLLFRTRRHSRQYEEAADSMALELLRPSGFDLRGCLSALALLDSSDQHKYPQPLELKSRFNFPGYAFKASWLENDELSFAVRTTARDSAERDSLRTHPDCPRRIARLTPRGAGRRRRQPAPAERDIIPTAPAPLRL